MSQDLYLVLGGQMKDTTSDEFADPRECRVVGIYPSYREALASWRSASQSDIDDAFQRYVIVHLHDLSPANIAQEDTDAMM